MTVRARIELAGILRGGAGALAKWTTLDGKDPFESFKASTFGEIEQRGKVRDEKKEVGIQHDLGQELSEEQRRQLEKEEEEAEALLLAGREAVQSRKFEGKIYQASYADIRKGSCDSSLRSRSSLSPLIHDESKQSGKRFRVRKPDLTNRGLSSLTVSPSRGTRS